jgi:hypothetical protein
VTPTGKPAVAAAAVAATQRIKEKVGGQNNRAKSRSPNPREGEMANVRLRSPKSNFLFSFAMLL